MPIYKKMLFLNDEMFEICLIVFILYVFSEIRFEVCYPPSTQFWYIHISENVSLKTTISQSLKMCPI